jgi:hypothetical protein
VSAILDGTNAAISLARGDTIAATMYALQALPGIGEALQAARIAGRLGMRLVGKSTSAVFRGLKRGKCFIVRSTGLTRFGFKGCFEAGTQVLAGYTPEGQYLTRSIEEVRVGDYVLAKAENDAGDSVELRRVTEVFRYTKDHLRVLTFLTADGQEQVIKTTDEHPLYVEGKGWVGASGLLVGDRILQSDGGYAVLQSTLREEHASGVTVYNLTVEGDHTYFVDDQVAGGAVWVHNDCVYLQVVRGKVRYVGRTGQRFEARAAQQLRNHGRVVEVIEGLENITRQLARAIEHKLILKYGRKGIDPRGTLTNINRGIQEKKLELYAKELKQAEILIKKLGL